jgi:molybdate transport system substrate-binding protein
MSASRTALSQWPSLLAGLALSLPFAPARAGDVTVAVAANFAAPLARIAEGFTAATGHVLKSSAGATGKFYTQIALGGAPFHVLLAADDETPKRLIDEGHAVAGSAFTYAIGQLVLWSAWPGVVDADGAVLASGRFDKLAIANPKIAPYGQAAMQVLEARGLALAVTSKLVMADSIAQAYQFVSTGNADIGFIALSQVTVPGRPTIGSMWRVPASLHAPIRQDAVLLRTGRDNPAATALMAYLKTAPAREVIAAYGYGHAAP